MIFHTTPIAILTSERADIQDPEVKQLATISFKLKKKELRNESDAELELKD